jgi:DNA replication protein DnaC
MKQDFKKIIPTRFHSVSYEIDVTEAIKELAITQIRSGNGLYLYGESGVGKTHTICAIAKKVILSGIEIMFFNTGDFLDKLRDEFNKTPNWEDENHQSLFREVMDFDGVLFLDDIGAEKASEWVRERLYLIINKKYEDLKPIIFTSNCDLEILSARLGDRVTSRIMGMAEILELDGVDRRNK